MLSTLLQAGKLGSLYLTVTHQIIGGENYDTIPRGGVLDQAGQLGLGTLYYDPGAPNGVGQWFAQFDCQR